MTLSNKIPSVTLVIGASGGIGRAVVQRLAGQAGLCDAAGADPDPYAPAPIEREPGQSIITVSRSDQAPCPGVLLHKTCDYSEEAIAEVCTELSQSFGDIHRVIICNGVLHGDGIRPERSMKQIKAHSMAEVLQANTITPMLWLSGLFDVIKRSSAPRIAVLSARVGSIGDNGLGGWYSYRGSKAALNMMLQCAAIELHRANRAAGVMAFHPGTTDTALSKPFQKGVPEGKLFTPGFVADCLLREMEKAPAGGQLHYVDWAGVKIPW